MIYIVLFVLSLANVVEAKTPQVKQASPTPQDDSSYFENVLIYSGATKVPVKAKQAIIIDFKTGKVLLEKNADQRMSPSSMTKMMTTYLVEEKLQKKELSNETQFLVSERAWRTQGSKMFIHVGDSVKVADLHRGVAIQSGNDAAIALAEGSFGSEGAFVGEMNRMAKKLNMNASHFKNSHGLHEEDHYSTARDLGKLGIATIRDHAEFYYVNQEKDFTYNGIKQGNRNPLLYDNIGCDGIKTGHTDAGGYGVTASCVFGDQRIVMVINGLDSMSERASEAKKLVAWTQENFVGKYIVKKGDVIEKAAPVTDGVKSHVPLVAADDLYLVMLRTEQDKVSLTPMLENNLVAPLAPGIKGGKIYAGLGQSLFEVDLITTESVERLGWMKRMFNKVSALLTKVGI